MTVASEIVFNVEACGLCCSSFDDHGCNAISGLGSQAMIATLGKVAVDERVLAEDIIGLDVFE